jgi:hypothetical protein
MLGREDDPRFDPELAEYVEEVSPAAIDGRGVREHGDLGASETAAKSRKLSARKAINSP